MANQADVLIKNQIKTQEGNQSITVDRMFQGNSEYNTTIGEESSEQINLQSTEVSLVIELPTGEDLKYFGIDVDSAVDLETISSRTDSKWTLKIIPNELDPEIPTTVNVEISPVEPE